MRRWQFVVRFFLFLAIITAAASIMIERSYAETAQEINSGVDQALKSFNEVRGGDDLIKRAKGVLVFPRVYKAGIGIGGEYGEGALRIKGRTADYYSTAAASIGFQLGAQMKTLIIAFMKDDALKNFRSSDGWKIGVDASIAVIAIGAGGAIDSATYNLPIVAFVIGQKGLMYNVTLEGSKITKIKK